MVATVTPTTTISNDMMQVGTPTTTISNDMMQVGTPTDATANEMMPVGVTVVKNDFSVTAVVSNHAYSSFNKYSFI